MNRLRISCGFAILFTILLVGCRSYTIQEIPTQASPRSASPTPTASPTPLSGPITPAPTAPSSVLPTPPPLEREEKGILRALYGDQLQGNAEDGWSVGLGTVPWVGATISGSFTASGAPEMAAFVGGLSTRATDVSGDEEYLDVRWVVLRDEGASAQSGDQAGRWHLLGRSPSLGFNLDRSAILWRVLSLTDFDQDGRQELFAVSGSTSQESQREVTYLFRWDGESLAQIWTETTYEDNTGTASAPTYLVSEAEVAFAMSDGTPELVLQGTTRYFGTNAEGRADVNAVLGSETIDRRFRWDGVRFRERSAAGPTTPFAFTDADGLWLWESGEPRPLDKRRVDNVAWSPDGLRLAYEVWWPSEEQGVWLYDTQAGTATRIATTEGAAYGLHWSPDGLRLAYPLATPAEIRLWEPRSGAETSLSAEAESVSWAPDGQRLVYTQRGGLVRYDLTNGRVEPLVTASEDAGTTAPGVYRPAWSPRGDLVACVIADADTESLTLVTPDLPGPVELAALPNLTTGLNASRMEISWSPPGDRVAVLVSDPRSLSRPSALYVAAVRAGWTGETALELQELARVDDPAQPVSSPAWSPDGQRLAAVVGTEVWVWDAESASGQRWHVFPVAFEEVSAAWEPSGSGFLVRHGEQIHWFTADSPGAPAPLLQRSGLDRIGFPSP